MSDRLAIAVLERSLRGDLPLVLAPLADRLGYSRYWITEHDAPTSPYGSAAVYATRIAALTARIRVGTAGILLRYYPAALAAMQFRLLASMFPDRIDAGFCHGMSATAGLLTDDVPAADADPLPKVRRLVAYTRGTSSRVWPPRDAIPPAMWWLASRAETASRAGALGVSYAYPLQFAFNRDDPEPMRVYRRSFVPCEHQAAPGACLAVAGYCSDSAADVEAVLASPARPPHMNALVTGSPDVCRSKLLELAERYEVNEIAFACLATDEAPARRCLEQLADAMQL